MIFGYLYLLLCSVALGLQTGDRIITSFMSQHDKSRTNWIDMPFNLMPRFKMAESVIYHVVLPRPLANSSDTRLDITSDLQISIAIDNQEHLLSWINVFNSDKKQSLRKLRLVFTVDDMDIVSVTYETEYNPKLTKIDPSHPTLRGFQLEYEWRDAPVEDPRFGLQVLCFSCFIGFIILLAVIVINADFESEKSSEAADGPPTRRTNSKALAERKRK